MGFILPLALVALFLITRRFRHLWEERGGLVQLQFDLMIAVFVGFALVLALYLGPWPPGWAARASVWFYLSTGLVVVWGSFVEPYLIKVRKYRFAAQDWPRPADGSANLDGKPIRAVLLSDIHAGHHNGPMKLGRWVQRINALDADLVLIAGDFLEEHLLDKAAVGLLEALKKIEARNGVYAVPGNHDYGIFIPGRKKRADILEAVRAELDGNVRFLLNEAVDLSINGRDLSVVGLDDCWSENMDGRTALELRVGLKLVMAHNPDSVDELKGLTDALVVSGHTHGGQIRLPFIGQIVKQTYTKYGRSYSRGIFDLGGNSKLLVTSGLGATTTRARLFCPPEIVVLEIY